MNKTFPTINSLKSGMKTNEVKFLDNDLTLPYVQKDKQYYYFSQSVMPDYQNFVLVMTFSKDLGEAQ